MSSKYGASNLQDLKDQEKEVYGQIGGNKDRAPWIKLEKGKNFLRLYPARSQNETFIVPRTTVWLEKLVKTKKDDGQEEEKWVRKPVFNAKVHNKSLKRDLVECYVELATKLIPLLPSITSIKDIDERTKEIKRRFEIINHWQNGLVYGVEWVAYAHKISTGKNEFGLVSLKPAVKFRLNNIAASQDVPGSAIVVDPFTDPETGMPVSITWDPQSEDKKKVWQTDIVIAGKYPISDEEIANWEKFESLSSLYSNVYTIRDFNIALTGLARFDEQHKIGIIMRDEFVELAQEIKAEVEAVTPKEDEKPSNVSDEENEELSEKFKSAKTAEKFEDTAGFSKIEDLNKENVDTFIVNLNRDELKAFSQAQNFKFTILNKMSDEEIRQSIRDEVSFNSLLGGHENELDQVETSGKSSKKKETAEDIKKRLNLK